MPKIERSQQLVKLQRFRRRPSGGIQHSLIERLRKQRLERRQATPANPQAESLHIVGARTILLEDDRIETGLPQALRQRKPARPTADDPDPQLPSHCPLRRCPRSSHRLDQCQAEIVLEDGELEAAPLQPMRGRGRAYARTVVNEHDPRPADGDRPE